MATATPGREEDAGPGEGGNEADHTGTVNSLTAEVIDGAVQSGVINGGVHHYPTGSAIGPIIQVGKVVGGITTTLSPSNRTELDHQADQLAIAVQAQWRREEESRQVNDPYPFPVRWRAASAAMTDNAENISRSAPGSAPVDLAPAGELATLPELYSSIPSGRLAVLGRAGSGKTIFAIELCLKLLAMRRPQDAVPVIFSLGSWNPERQELRDWLAAQLRQHYPGLRGRKIHGIQLARLLTDSGYVLPVLDGFDEIAPDLQATALKALNQTTAPLVLTSRSEQFATVVSRTGALAAAAVVELQDVDLADLVSYLPRTVRNGQQGPANSVWSPVLRRMIDAPGDVAVANLTRVLSTPLMVTLGRAVYSEDPSQTPETLLDRGTFPTPESIEHHLLDAFVTSAYLGTFGRGHTGWPPDAAQRWLRYLARRMSRKDTLDFAWWQFPTYVVPTTLRYSISGGMCGITFTLLALLSNALLPLIHWPEPLPTLNLPAAIIGPPLIGALSNTLLSITRIWRAPPATLPMVAARRSRLAGKPLAGAALTGLGTSLMCDYLIIQPTIDSRGFYSEKLHEDPTQLYAAVVILFLGPAAGMAMRRFLRFANETSTYSPQSSMRDDRTAGLVLGGALASLLLLGMLMNAVMPSRQFSGVTDELTYYAICVAYLSPLTVVVFLWSTRWAHFVALQCALAFVGKTPWRLVTFLEDAHRRGILRQVGPIYQFRHARLQERLAGSRTRAAQKP